MVAVVPTMMAAVVALAEAVEAVMTAAAPMVPTVMAVMVPAEVDAAAPAIEAPIVVMAVTAVAPSVVPVAVATPANLRCCGLPRCCRFQGSEPRGRSVDWSAHQARETQHGGDGANSPPRHFH
jgi:hypothetical protein